MRSYQVVNGATKFGDMEHFKKEMEKFRAQGKEVNMEYMGDLGLIALQGTRSSSPGPFHRSQGC